MTGLISLAHPASHARDDAIQSLAKEEKEGWGRGGRERGREVRAGPRMRCQPALPVGDVQKMWGEELYRTAEVTNRALDRVSPLISATCKNTCKDKSRVQDSLRLPGENVCNGVLHGQSHGPQVQHICVFFTLIQKRIVCTPSKKTEVVQWRGDEAEREKGKVKML